MIRKVILAPDEFNGIASAVQVCQAMVMAVKAVCPNAICENFPLTNGGEYTAKAFSAFKGAKKVSFTARGPFLDEISGYYISLDDGKTVIIETAEIIGLSLTKNRKDPLRATTYGLGEVIRQVLSDGAKKIILSLGESATNDGGAGMAAALGTRFVNSKGVEFIPTGGNLTKLVKIDNTLTDILLKGVEVMVMCDTVAPLCGKNGASEVYGAEKGATSDMIKLLDEGLYNLSNIISDHMNINILNPPGSGAAGGLGGGAVAFLGGNLVSGIDVMLDITGFDLLLKNTDVVITGEGKIDDQTTYGSAVSGIAKRAKAKGVPVIAVSGDIGETEYLHKLGITSVFSTNLTIGNRNEQKKLTLHNITLATQSALRLVDSIKK